MLDAGSGDIKLCHLSHSFYNVEIISEYKQYVILLYCIIIYLLYITATFIKQKGVLYKK